MKRGMFILLLACFWEVICAQQYTGLTGLIQAPSAEMNGEGDAMIGAHFLNKEFTPDNFRYQKEKYHTISHYLSITPFSWVEIGYTCTFLRTRKDGSERVGFFQKDRYFSLKLRPLKEGRYWPAVAVGTNDPHQLSKEKKDEVPEIDEIKSRVKSQYFGNYYIAATKHFDFGRGEWGVHAAYRKFKRTENAKWTGMVGGLTYRPSFYKDLRLIGEYTGDDFNIGADVLLWKHLLIQASVQGGKYFNGGICYKLNLF